LKVAIMDILEAYVTAAPSDQAVIDIFDGQWSSKMPAGLGLASRPGNAALFEDARITWLSHYYDEAPLQRLGKPFAQFEAPEEFECQGGRYRAARRDYGEALRWEGFCGGGASSALWLTRESLFQALSDIGFVTEAIGFDAPDHPNGPALALVAQRTAPG
jgi:hypothetical protein